MYCLVGKARCVRFVFEFLLEAPKPVLYFWLVRPLEVLKEGHHLIFEGL